MSRQYFEGQLQEHRRLERYQLQHRGLNFQQVWLPPSTDRRVNMVGKNQHIYRGLIPTAPMDELPPEVDPESIDKEKLYEELVNLTFPEVPPREDYGPTRRVGGEYTKAKRLTFSPVVVRNEEEEHCMHVPILGVDGKVYKGSIRNHLLPRELDPRLSGSKRTQMYHWKTDSTYVNPTVVSLHVDGKCYSEQRSQVPLIQVYMSDLKTMTDAAGSGAREMSFVPRSGKENVGTFQNAHDDEGSTTEEPVISEVEEDIEGEQGDDVTVVTEEEDTSVTEYATDESSNVNADEESVGESQEPSEGESQEPSGGETQDPSGGETQDPSGGETQDPSGGESQEPNVADDTMTENSTDPSVVDEDIIVGPSNEPVSEPEGTVDTPQEQNAENSGDPPVATEAQEEG